MKKLNKENLKWWGSQKNETWATKVDGEWWIFTNKKQNKTETPEKRKQKQQRNGKILNYCLFYLFGFMGGISFLPIVFLVLNYAK